MTSGADGGSITTPNTVLVHEHVEQTLPAAKKQKQDAAANEGDASSATPKRSFKTIANLVLAMKRFQSALNPQYEYGKQKSQMVARQAIRTPSPTSSQGTQEKPAHSHGDEHYAYADRGHKGNFLFKKLPDAPSEEEQ